MEEEYPVTREGKTLSIFHPYYNFDKHLEQTFEEKTNELNELESNKKWMRSMSPISSSLLSSRCSNEWTSTRKSRTTKKTLPISPLNTSQRLHHIPRETRDRMQLNGTWFNRNYHFLQPPANPSKREYYQALLQEIGGQVIPIEPRKKGNKDTNYQGNISQSYNDYLEALRFQEEELFRQREMLRQQSMRGPINNWYEIKHRGFTEEIMRFNDRSLL